MTTQIIVNLVETKELFHKKLTGLKVVLIDRSHFKLSSLKVLLKPFSPSCEAKSLSVISWYEHLDVICCFLRRCKKVEQALNFVNFFTTLLRTFATSVCY
jgi:hypothetical protein